MHLTKVLFKRAAAFGATAALAAGSVAGLTLLGASPAAASSTTNYNVVFNVPIFGGYGQQSVSVVGAAPATAVKGSNFTATFTPAPEVIPTTDAIGSVVGTLSSIMGLVEIVPIPAGATYVSSSVSGSVTFTATSTTAAGSVPLTATYCTATTTACTATPNGAGAAASFNGDTTTPYLEMATPGSGLTAADAADELPAGSTATFPTVSVVLTASGSVGAVVSPALSEFDTTANVLSPLVLTTEVEAWPAAVLTSAEMAAGSALPANLVTPMTATTIVSPPPPAPTVTAVSPSSGIDTGGTSITITGTGFTSGATVTVGGTAATGVTVNSATSITATTPGGTDGVANVVVTDAGGSSAISTADDFTYTPPVVVTTTTTTTTPPAAPTVTGVTPGGVQPGGGTLLTITGTGFTSGATVKVGGTPATGVTVVSSTEITAVAPVGTKGTVADVVVTDAGGSSSTSSADQVTYLPVAAIGSVLLMGLLGGLFVLEQQRRRRQAAQNS